MGVEDSVSYTYDANGNVLTVTDNNGTITREYDALNRVTKYTDTYGKSICYEYDAVGNLTRMVYPDNTVVTYTYDANNNLVSVTDWANRVTAYTYDVNNRVIGVTKPDGSVTATTYDNKQRVTSTVERTASGTVITGFEYVYDTLGRILEESRLANNTKVCYTYDNLSRVTKRTITNLNNEVISEESFTYDAAGNLLSSADCCEGQSFAYDTNNRLTAYNGQTISYDLDGNMLSAPLGCETTTFEYDSANRLIKAGEHAYTYNAEDVRIRNLCCESDTTYTYNTNCRLSQLLQKTTDGIVTKYVYGLGLIGEEKSGVFKTYHFDYRGSTIAITDMSGNITDTFEYDTYGRATSRTGNSEVIFGYNGRDGVVTDENELIYMRARYYSPELRRFVNADIIPGEISNAVTLNRYAYANGNPVTNVDPFGLSAERGGTKVSEILSNISDIFESITGYSDAFDFFKDTVTDIYDYAKYGFRLVRKGNHIIVKGARTAAAVRRGIAGTRYSVSNAGKYWDILGDINLSASLKSEFSLLKPSGRGINGGAVLNYLSIALKTGVGIAENIESGTRTQKIVSDAIVDVAVESGIIAGSTIVGSIVGSFIPVPVLGTMVGAAAGYLAGEAIDRIVNEDIIAGKSIVDWTKEGAGWVADRVVDAGEWIVDTASDAWDATTDFFEDAGNALGNFFAGNFG